MKKVISLCLLIAMLCSVLLSSSCDGITEDEYTGFYPKGYTGGFSREPGATTEFWWVETYEECIEAIKLLKSHGSTFTDDALLAYDGDLFDCKYCFMMNEVTGIGGATEKIEWGDNPFDRYAKDVYLFCFAFFDDISIDELNYSTVARHNGYLVAVKSQFFAFKNEINVDNIEITQWTKILDRDKETNKYDKDVYYNDHRVLHVETSFFAKEEEVANLKMTDECIKVIIESGKIINPNKISDKER